MSPQGDTPPPDGAAIEFTPRHAEAVVRLIETSSTVSRRHQFFVWSQGPLHAMLPHQVLVCGAYTRQRRSLGFSAFQSVVLSETVMAALSDGTSPLLRACVARWVNGGGRPLQIDPAQLDGDAGSGGRLLSGELPGVRLVVHGVSRPQRLGEVESLFVFACSDAGTVPGERQRNIELVMPYLHATWRHVQGTEAELGVGPHAPASSAGSPSGSHLQALTQREREILQWAREGKSNPQIGEALGISALTVKNHIQKILRKLGARNRAHAVALAMSQALLKSHPDNG